MVTIVNYGLGNIRSIQKALEFIGEKVLVTDSPVDILNAKRLILPGVGSYKKAMENIKDKMLLDVLNESVMNKKTPILGICLGMQLFSDYGDEHGGINGFGWIPGSVVKFKISDKFRVPHIGFNTVSFSDKNNFLTKTKNFLDFYFVHSYYFKVKDKKHSLATTNYGCNFISAVSNDNIFGVQFHPEKSQGNGLYLLKNFCNNT